MSRTLLNDLSVETTLNSTETLEIVGSGGLHINFGFGRGGFGHDRFDRRDFHGPRHFGPRFDHRFDPRFDRRRPVRPIHGRRPIRFRP